MEHSAGRPRVYSGSRLSRDLHNYKNRICISKNPKYIKLTNPFGNLVRCSPILGNASKFLARKIMRTQSALPPRSSRSTRHLMKVLAFAVVAASLGSSISAWADTYGSNGGTTLNLPANWIDETNAANTGIGIPGATDIAQWDNNDANVAATTFTLGADTTWLGIKLVNPAAAVTIGTGVNNLTLGASGIDLSTATQNLTVATLNLVLGSSQSFNVTTARTLTVSAPVSLGANTLTFAGAGASVVTGAITDTGGGSLIVAGPGSVTLSGANAYTGTTALNAGTLVINNATAIGTGAFTIAGGTLNSTVAGIALSNNNTQAINGSFTFTGTQSLNLGTGAVTLGATPVITVTANTLTEGGVISGGFGLTKAGAGTLVVAGANTFTGPVAVNAGILNFNALSALGAGTILNFGGGTLQYATGNTADISTDTVTFTGNATLDTNSNTVTLANSIGNGGAGGFTKAGAGVLTLAPTNAYLGNTTVTAGTLNFAGLAALGSGAAINIGNGTLQYATGNADDITARTVTTTAAGSTIDINGNNVVYAIPIAGTTGLTFSSTAGAASVTLNPTNAYSGATTLNPNVTLVLGNGLTLQNSLVTVNAGSNINFNGATAVSFGGLAGAQSLALNGATLTLLNNGNGAGSLVQSYTGGLSDGTAVSALTKDASSTAIGINGSLYTGAAVETLVAANSYSGPTTVNGGILQLNFSGAGAAVSNIISVSSPLVLGGGIIAMVGTTGASNQSFNGLTLNAGGSQLQTFRASSSSATTAVAAITRNIGSTLDFQSRPSGGGSTSKVGASDGTDQTTTANANFPGGSASILGGYATFNATSWAVSASAGVAEGNITALATFNTTYAAGTNVDSPIGTPNIAAAETINSLRFNNAGSYALTLGGNLVIATGGILETSTVGTNPVTISGNTLTSANTKDLIVIANDPTGTMTINSNITDNGAASIGVTKSGPGTLVLNPAAANTFTGQVTVNLGILQLGNANALNTTTPVAVVIGGETTTFGTSAPTFFTGSGVLQLTGNSATIGSLSSVSTQPGTAIVRNTSATPATLTVNAATTSSSFAGTVIDGVGGGALSLTKTGGNTFTLSGANTYSGNTTVNGGKLALVASSNNISGSKNILIGSSGTLDVTGIPSGFALTGTQTLTGSGTVLGALSTASGTTINPGSAGVGTLTAGGLTLNTGAVLNFEFGTGNDLINLTTTNGLTLNGSAGGIKLNIINTGTTTPFTTAGTYDLFQYLGAIGGTGLTALTDFNLPTGTSAVFGTTSNATGPNFVTLTLGVAAVPTYALTGSGTWNDPNSFTPTGIPNGPGQSVLFGSSITAPSTVTLDATQTIGSLSFNNLNAYTLAPGTGGALVFDNGASSAHLSGSAGNHVISAPVTLNSNLAATIAGGSVTISGVLSDGIAPTTAKSLTMDGAGTLVLSNANTYRGGTFINGGILQITNNLALGSGALTFTGLGSLQAGADALAPTTPIALTAGAVGTVDTNGFTMTLASAITSTDATSTFAKAGAGTLVLTGAKAYTGTTLISGGKLQLGDGTTTATLGAGPIVDNASLVFNTTGTPTFANNISGSGSIVQNGTNAVSLTGTNSFNGGTTINGGTLILVDGGTNAGNSPITLTGGGTLTLGAGGNTVVNLTNTINVPTGQTANYVYNSTTANTGFGGALTGGGTLNMTFGTITRHVIFGDWSLFTGTVNIAAATQFRTSNTVFNAPGTTFNLPSGSTIYANSANSVDTLGSVQGAGDIGGNGDTTSATATFQIGAAVPFGSTDTFTGTVTNGAGSVTSITKQGAGTLDLAGANSFTGALGVTQGTLTFLGATQVPSTVTALSMGSATTTGTLDLTGFTTLNVAALNTAAGTPAGNTIGSSSTAGGVITLNYATGTSTFAGSIVDSLNGGTQQLALTINSGNLTLTGANTYTGGTIVNSGKLQLGAGGAGATSGSIVAPPGSNINVGGTLAFGRSDNVSFQANIIGNGNVSQVGTGVTTLTGANTYSGNTTLTAGTLQVGAGGTLGNGSSPLIVTAGTLDLNGNSATVGSLSGAAAGIIDNVAGGGASTLTTGSLGATGTFAGTIQNTTGSVALVKTGTGNLTLSGGASTFSGGTTLNSGGLYVTNTTGSATGSGPVTLNGGTLGGTGFIGGAITAGTAAHIINPGANTGNSIGTLTAGGLSTNGNTTLAFDLTAPGGTNDLLAITGTITLGGGTVAINSLPLSGQPSLGYYKVMTYGGSLTGPVSSMVFPANANTNNILYTLDTSTPGVINIHKGFIGDLNDDGNVDITDLNTVLANLGTTTSSWSAGNFDGARTIDLTDLNDVLNNIGTSVAGGSTVVSIPTPEPTSLGLLAMGAAALIARRRKA
jgi:fibronectin-binding autotransporter adhesin